MHLQPSDSSATDNPAVQAMYAKVAAQGDVVRKLKSDKAAKEEVDAAVKVCIVPFLRRSGADIGRPRWFCTWERHYAKQSLGRA